MVFPWLVYSFPDKSLQTLDVTGNEYHTYEPTGGCCGGSGHVVWKTWNNSHVDTKHLKVKSWQIYIVFIFTMGGARNERVLVLDFVDALVPLKLPQ